MPKNLKESSGKDKGALSQAPPGGISQKEDTSGKLSELKEILRQRERALEIEAALERVRSRSMAMQSSEELNDVLSVLYQQFDLLGIQPLTVWLTLWNTEENTFTYRSTGISGKRIQGQQVVDIEGMDIWKSLYDKWKSGVSEDVEVLFYSKKDLEQLFNLMAETFEGMPEEERLTAAHTPEGGYSVQGHCKFGYIGYTHTAEPTQEEKDILSRFAKEFGRVYQRFLDIGKAEAQAREAQIEAALERVRSKTMAMHNSEDVSDTVITLFNEVVNLGLDKTIRCGIGILQGHEGMETWSANSDQKGDINLKMGMLNMTGHPMLVGLIKAWKKGDKGYSYDFIGKDVIRYYTVLNNEPDYPFHADLKTLPGNQFANVFFFTDGVLFAFTQNPLKEEAKKVLERFASVFGQTYRRYLDLQKAEAQARESQIEAALERVRARTMAMHNTDDIADTVTTFFEELISLGLGDSTRCGIGILNPSEIMEVWTASIQNDNKSTLHTGFLEMWAHPMLKGLQEHWAAGKALYEAILKGADKLEYFKAINEAPEYPVKMDLDALPPTVYHYSFLFPQGTLFVFSESPLHEEIRDIFTRFSSVFGQTYTRYLDLERAEKQARESKIEAALERVRAKAMAMHSSEDLRQTITTIFEELKKLEVQFIRLGLGLIDPEEPKGEIVTSRLDESGEIIEVSGTFRMEGHPVLDGVYSHFKSQEEYFPVLQGDEINSYYAALSNSVKDIQGYGTESKHYGCFLYFPEGGFYAWATTPHTEEQVGILKKFSRVVEITYRRYKDLVEAESREKEAVKQASLDRVRAEIASMRTAEDLERITPLVWKELTILGIPFFRCGVFIMDEARQLVHVYLTTPAGKALGAMDLPFDFGMSLIQKGVDYWRRQKILVEEWDQAQFIEMTQKLMAQGQVKDAKSYQAGEKPPKRLVLHQVPFAQGMLYVGNSEHLTGREMDIVKALTRTFAVAYARYEDFKELEKAKKKVENTLDDLQAAQSQLIQSEKMASLGELTAGIAHEIKNPLNFVNNFSEVSRELLEELMEEMEKGDLEEVKSLAEDLVQNLEKIVHHGKRADSIVKGMLQHSRSSDGHREPTDLNALTDEYVRLAYHGLRAKDKSFNATVNTHFDPGLGTLEVVPQDIGRVILNLLTNAFYAVSEKSLGGASSENGKYEPTVTIETQRVRDQLKISVSDNGDGIPKKVLEKIFQPFFTTKPTGQGTGLGLSLSYDIVKAHGGELKVETTQGEGTTFYMNFKTETA